MNLSTINPNLPCLRLSACSNSPKRRMSSSTNSKSTYSSSCSTQSKTLNSLPVLIQLCTYSNEEYALKTMKTLFSSRHKYSSNVCDEFDCNLLMYTLRYQRYQLFDYLLNEISLDLNLRAKDQQGNTIIHYAIIYSNHRPEILEILIDKFKRFGIDIDQRNIFGFTPLLLAIFCGKYDFVLTLLTKTESSPFVRDFIHLKNMIDYLQNDIIHRDSITSVQNHQSFCLNRESTRLRVQLYQTLPSSHQTNQHYPSKNFFEQVFPQAVQDRSGSIRLSIIKECHNEYIGEDLTHLIQYINHRYPRINTAKKQETYSRTTTQLVFQQNNSKTSIHNIFNLFDPKLRPKATVQPRIITTTTTQSAKPPITFKRLGAKLTVLAALSRPQSTTKPRTSLITNDAK